MGEQEHTVVSGLACGLVELAVSKGASRQALIGRSGIDPDKLSDPDYRVPFSNYIALMRAGKELAADPALALHYGETVDLTEFSVVGLIIHACETMLEAHVQLNRYGRLVIEVDVGIEDRFQLQRHDGKLWVVDTRRNPNEFPEITECAFAHMVCAIGRFSSGPLAREVHFTHLEPAYRAEYDRIFQAPASFGMERNAVQIDDAWPSHRVALQPRFVFGILSAHADALLKKLSSSKTFRDRVESLLTTMLHTGQASVDKVAETLGVSRATVYRRLKTEGVTFETVLDELRHKLALHYLSGQKASVNDIAYLIGFSDSTALSRAFKRWTGYSPRSMRGKIAGGNSKLYDLDADPETPGCPAPRFDDEPL